jgi:DNA polymerase III alpha subunit (gram-positive type)
MELLFLVVAVVIGSLWVGRGTPKSTPPRFNVYRPESTHKNLAATAVADKDVVPAPPVLKPISEPFAFCALDTETTGLVTLSRRHRAFEISCVKFTPIGNMSFQKEMFTRYIIVDDKEMKGLRLSPQWRDHVSAGGQKNAVRPSVALYELREFVRDLPLVCHNAKFDKCVIENELEKSTIIWNATNRWICTLEMARSRSYGKFIGYNPGRDDGLSFKLIHVAEALSMSIEHEKFHFGYYDAEVTGELFLKLYHELSVPIVSRG